MNESDHFKGKNPLQHIVEVQAGGIEKSSEIHGVETPGMVFAFYDSFREVSVLIALFALVAHYYAFTFHQSVIIALSLSCGYVLWRFCRAAHLAYFRLERLHRVAFEEKREIECNRDQEKEELKALYRVKGFEGELLDDVVNVLMADSERCLRVMLEEEMGFRLEENQHPLLLGLGGALGVIASFIVSLGLYYLFDIQGVCIGAVLVSAYTWSYVANRERNRIIPAFVWGASEAIASILVAYFMLEVLHKSI